MAQTLILMRHAKSAWNIPGQEDFDRALNGRGHKSAAAIGAWLAAKGHLPDLVLVSGARRTVETWERMAPYMPETAEMESALALYLASADTLLNVLKNQTARSVMLIGHNPGIGEFASSFAKTTPDHPKFAAYPTTATTVFQIGNSNWRDLSWGQAEVAEFVVPRDLLEA